jgi:hypothetical protein
MTKHLASISLLLLINTVIFAQDSIFFPMHKFEVSLNYAIQRPFYSITTPLDIIALPHLERYRSRIGVGSEYYVFNELFIEYQTAYSQEGGGFKEQYTNANYWKNGIYVGFCSNQNRKVIFNIYTGADLNILLNAKFKNAVIHKTENVSGYFNRFVISFPVLGVGFKTRIYENLFLKIQTCLSMTNYRISTEKYTNVSQVIFPAFQISLSEFLK